MVVAARALAKLRLVSVFACIPPTTHHPHKLNLAISQLPVVRSEHVRTFFGSISKTNKTLVDDHVITEATAGYKLANRKI